MTFKIPLGTKGKLVCLLPNKDAEVKDWTTRKELAFIETIIDPTKISEFRRNDVLHIEKQPLAVRLAVEGYALFGGDDGGDRTANYVLAIPYREVIVV